MAKINVSQSIEDGLSRIFEYLPQVLGALVLLVVGYFVAKIIQRIVRKLLVKLRFDRAVAVSPAGNIIHTFLDHPSRSVAKLGFWLVFIGFISLAISVLDIPALTAFVAAVYGYIPNVIAAMVIFLVASAVSAGSAKFIQRVMGNSPTANVLKTVGPAITMSIATFMILNQLGIARDIVNITYVAIMGAVALGLGLSFGLGGRDLAARLLDQAYRSTQRNNSFEEVGSALSTAKTEAKNKTGKKVNNLKSM